MEEQESTGERNNALIAGAQKVGRAAGKIAAALGAGKQTVAAPAANLYQAEYLGSGTFIIRKPKRKKRKARQSQLKNPVRGSRK